jgi:hypothetical protein
MQQGFLLTHQDRFIMHPCFFLSQSELLPTHPYFGMLQE